jgi:hypothetical protein
MRIHFQVRPSVLQCLGGSSEWLSQKPKSPNQSSTLFFFLSARGKSEINQESLLGNQWLTVDHLQEPFKYSM